MEISAGAMLTISILVSFMMIIIFGLIYYSERQARQLHILEFWISYGSYFVVSLLTQGKNLKIVALSSLIWIWRNRTIRLILEDVSGKKLYKSWHAKLLFAGYSTSVTLGFLDYGFTVMTLPTVVVISFVGSDYIITCYKSIKSQKLAIPHRMLLATVTWMYAFILTYPYLRYAHEYSGAGFGVVLLTTILMAVILPSVAIYDLQKAQQDFLKKIIDERGVQLEGQSKFYALGEMTAEIVHEINNPLGIILGRTTHLKNQVIKDEAQKDFLLRNLDQIEATSERMSSIIRSLKKFSKVQKSEAQCKVKINDLIKETLSFCEERFRHAGVELIVDVIPDIELSCHSVQISQVILNLLNNAHDAVSETKSPWIHIFVTKNSNSLRIHVKDSGNGVPESLKHRIMEPFFTTKDKGGTGLGLSISKKIMEEHGGKLGYDDSSKNTCFILELPLTQVAASVQSLRGDLHKPEASHSM